VEVLVQGALNSATIALVALGFSLVYGVGGIVNLAHGSFFMIGAYTLYELDQQGAPILVGAVAGVLVAGLAGVLLERLVISPIRHQEVTLLIATLAVAILVQQLVRSHYGNDQKGAPAFVKGAVDVLGIRVGQSRLFAAVAAVVAIAAVLLLLTKTAAGRMVRAVAEDEEAARLVGVRPERVTLVVVALGAALAGLAGVLVAPDTVVSPTMWLLPLTQAFAIVILGGLGSIWGTVLAAVIVGYLNAFVTYNIQDGSIKVGLVTVVVILVTLVLRPTGLLGKATVR
jgi:branched-subunit amino acid ABC-type transport system permease component